MPPAAWHLALRVFATAEESAKSVQVTRAGKERAQSNDRDGVAFRRTAGITRLVRSGCALPRGTRRPPYAKTFWGAGWKIFEDHVDVETADAKRIHSGTKNGI